MANNRLIVGLCAVLNLGAGFAMQWLVFYHLGVGRPTDALFASMALPQVVFTLVTGPLSNVLIPMLSSLDGDECSRRASATVSGVFLAAIPVVGLMYFTTGWWLPVLLPGFSAESLQLVQTLSRIQILGLQFSMSHGVLWAAAVARGRLATAEAALAGAALLALVALVPVADAFGVLGVAWVFALRPFLRVAALAAAAGYRPTVRLRRANLREVARRSTPIMLAGAYSKSELLLDTVLASLAPAGLLSLYNLATSLMSAGVGVLSKALIVPYAPRFGKLFAAGQLDALRAELRRGSRLAAGLGLAGWGGLLLLGRPVLGVVVGHGGVTPENVDTLWYLTLGLGGVLGGHLLGQLGSHGFFAIGRTRTISALYAVAFTAGAGMKLGGAWAGGVFGLAVGTTAYVLGGALLTQWAVRRELRTLL